LAGFSLGWGNSEPHKEEDATSAAEVASSCRTMVTKISHLPGSCSHSWSLQRKINNMW